jgi:hypothetical protein
MDLTMMRQICHYGRLAAKVKEDSTITDLAAKLFTSASSTDVTADSEVVMSDTQITQFRKANPLMPENIQHAIIIYLSQDCGDPHYQPISSFNYQASRESSPLIPQARHLHTFHFSYRNYSAFTHHIGNSAIHFMHPTLGHLYGFIQHVWQVPIHRKLRTFIIVHQHEQMKNTQGGRDIYSSFPELQCVVLSRNPMHITTQVIEPAHIISHLSVWETLPETVGINSRSDTVYVVCDALDRGRHR